MSQEIFPDEVYSSRLELSKRLATLAFGFMQHIIPNTAMAKLIWERMKLPKTVVVSKTAIIKSSLLITLGVGTYIDEYVELDGKITIGKDCTVYRGALIRSGVKGVCIGDGSGIGPYSVIFGGGGIKIGSNTQIAPHCVLVGDNKNGYEHLGIKGSEKGIRIGCNVWIGAHSTITDGVEIGDGAVIGAGSVVTKDVRPYTVVAGVPARELNLRNAEEAWK